MGDLTRHKDERGILVPIEFSTLPFVPERMFYITDVPKDTWRGGHAHFENKQVIICAKGKVLVKLIGKDKEEDFILEKNQSCFVDKMVWDSQQFIEPDSILVVLCSIPYDKDDYILDFQKFSDLISGIEPKK